MENLNFTIFVLEIYHSKILIRNTDLRSPIIYDKEGKPNAIIPANHKLMLLSQRIATKPSQQIGRGQYVLFKFFIDGEALSEGELHEASIKNPELHWAKAYIETHAVRDDQTVENSTHANPFIGKKIFYFVFNIL